MELTFPVFFQKPFVFTAVAVTAGGLCWAFFCFLSFRHRQTAGGVNKESKKVSGLATEAGVWRLRLYMCTVAGAAQTGETSASGQGGESERVDTVSTV